MSPFQMDVKLDNNFYSVIINMTICSICLIIRFYYIRKHKIQMTKVLFFGLFSILSAVLCLSAILTKLMMRKYRYREFPICMIIYVFSRSLYALHRAFLYAFLVWRIELANWSEFFARWTIHVAKFMTVGCGIFLVGGMIVFIESKKKKQLCLLNVNVEFLIAGWILDIVVCLMSSWLFLQPLLRILKEVDDNGMKNTVKKEALCVSIALISTVATAVCNCLVKGIMGISIGIDCSITSCCLVKLASPSNHKTENFCFLECLRAREDISYKQQDPLAKDWKEEEFIAQPSSTKRLYIEVSNMLAAFDNSSSGVETESVSAFDVKIVVSNDLMGIKST